ncbi:MAG TPA: glutamate--tRNA ligase [Deltaproteobacteria bacterium]|nr:glutamate--tRNA ligase [Deltaproteobacteria bacterium]
MKSDVRTRFAPSPTGALHIGGVRTALFAWLQARHHKGSFILRIEDTDAERSTEENTRQILESMEWLGLEWDEGPFFQSKRLDIYRSYLDRLLESGHAYWCSCTPDELEDKRAKAVSEGRKPKYDGTCRDRRLGPGAGRVVRFRMPDAGETSFDDLIKGRIAIDNAEMDDLVLLRSDGMPTYNFTVVVDDADMGMTHIIRGDDHVNNTPRQIRIYEALGFTPPLFAHVPMILGPDRTKLSKRHGATSVMAYRDMGYLPEALVNYLVRLSWSHGDQEIFSREELVEYFDINDVGKSAAIFNPDKLLWLNHHYIKTADPSRLARLLRPFVERCGYTAPDDAYLRDVVVDVRDRTKTLVEMVEFGDFYFADVAPARELRDRFLTPDILPVLEALVEEFSAAKSLDKESAEPRVMAVLKRFDMPFKALAQPLRVALTGKTVSPGIFEVMATLGRDRVIERLRKVLRGS